MTDSDWKPDLDEDALKALIRRTVLDAQGAAPDALPSKTLDRIKARAGGKLDVDGYIADLLAEQKKQ